MLQVLLLLLLPDNAHLGVGYQGGGLPLAGHTQRNQAGPTAGGPASEVKPRQRGTPNPYPLEEVSNARTKPACEGTSACTTHPLGLQWVQMPRGLPHWALGQAYLLQASRGERPRKRFGCVHGQGAFYAQAVVGRDLPLAAKPTCQLKVKQIETCGTVLVLTFQ
jgi:hypothetical protein